MSSDDTAARESFKAGLRAEWTLGTDWAEIAMRHIEAASRSIPAAAALLREAGWRVEEPKVCEECHGDRLVRDYSFWLVPCPTCNGTETRP